MKKLKQCHNGHFYEGDTCPYCSTQYYPVLDDTKASPYNPNTIPADTAVLAKYTEIPLCPHCGRPIRKYIPMPSKEVQVSSINNMGDGIVPWNYEWDGKCENCGHDFNIVMRIDMGSTGPDNREMRTFVRVSATGFNHRALTINPGEIGTNTVLSGVEIETNCGNGLVEKLFLSANELKYLMRALQNSPILKQWDYYVEG